MTYCTIYHACIANSCFTILHEPQTHWSFQCLIFVETNSVPHAVIQLLLEIRRCFALMIWGSHLTYTLIILHMTLVKPSAKLQSRENSFHLGSSPSVMKYLPCLALFIDDSCMQARKYYLRDSLLVTWQHRLDYLSIWMFWSSLVLYVK